MIDFLVRAHNEATWLPLLFKSIANQKDIQLGNILLLDNKSKDKPENIKKLFPSLKIIYEKFDEKYLPGRMLNYGIDILKKQCNKKDFVCIVSGHCFVEDKNSIKKIVDHLLPKMV